MNKAKKLDVENLLALADEELSEDARLIRAYFNKQAEKNAQELFELKEKQNEFAKTVLQVVHDIRSPLLVIEMLLKEIKRMPEDQRVPLRHAVQRINDIASNLLDVYKERSDEKVLVQKIPVAVLINRVLAEKRLQPTSREIEIKVCIESQANFSFISFQSSELHRILSNLINNAIDAISGHGVVEVGLKTNDGQLELSICDNGRGVKEKLLKKLGNYGATDSKEKGAGLGLAHAMEQINKYRGSLTIKSKCGQGTKIIIRLECVKPPEWFAQEIQYAKDTIFVIVDDDSNAHYFWDIKIKTLGIKSQVKHFYNTNEFKKWMGKNKKIMPRVILLSDNELIGSDSNGLGLIKSYKNKVAQAFLVTSHYALYELAPMATELKIKILPKELVEHIPIKIIDNPALTASSGKIDFVIVDDAQELIQAYKFLAKSKNRRVLAFNSPSELMLQLSSIPKNTVFYIDSQLENEKGEDFAKLLYEQGYKELYLATGALDPIFNQADYPWLKGVVDKPKFEPNS